MLAIKSAVYPTGIVDFAGWFQDYLALSLATYNSAYYINPFMTTVRFYEQFLIFIFVRAVIT